MLIKHAATFNRPLSLMADKNSFIIFSKPRKGKTQSLFNRQLSGPSNFSSHQDFKRRKIKDRVKDEPDTIPAGLAIGLMEIFGGTLAAFVPIPGFRWFSGVLYTDGARRIFNSLEQVQPSQNHPNAPPGVPEPRREI